MAHLLGEFKRREIGSRFSRDLPASVFVVIHIWAHGQRMLPEKFAKACRLQTLPAASGQRILPGHIYVAPPDHHLLVKPGHVLLARGPRENGHRPDCDALFRTAARAYGRRVIGIVLSGTGDDGTARLSSIKLQGGTTMVPAPEEAKYPDMPRSALEYVSVDDFLPISQLASTVLRLVLEPATTQKGGPVESEDMKIEGDMAELDEEALQAVEGLGTPSGFSCPDCGGVLWELNEHELVRSRCRIGHAWSPQGFLGQQSDAVERAIWSALRSVVGKKALAVRLGEEARARAHAESAARFDERAREAQENATVLKSSAVLVRCRRKTRSRSQATRKNVRLDASMHETWCVSAEMLELLARVLRQSSTATITFHSAVSHSRKGRCAMLGTILLILLIVMLMGSLPVYPYNRTWGYYPSGGLTLLVLILVILLLLGRI